MRSSNAIPCLLAPLIGVSLFVHAQAKEKIKLEVVSASTFTSMDWGTRTAPATPEQTVTTCKGTSGIYNPNYNSTCVSTTNPATTEHSVIWPTSLGAYNGVAVILPTGEHLILMCDADHDKHCGKFLNFDIAGMDKNCSDPAGIADINFRYLCIYTRHGDSTIGTFDAVITGDKITISGPDGRRTYRKYGDWGASSASSADLNIDNSESTNHQSEAVTPTPSQGSAIDQDEWRKAHPDDANSEFIAGADYFTQRDYPQAAALFLKAADQGLPAALYGLGMLYFNGFGVPQSYVEAYFWYDLAAARTSGANLIRFARERDSAAAKLSPTERDEVQQRAVRWFSEHLVQPVNP
jgi:hypothetical protein